MKKKKLILIMEHNYEQAVNEVLRNPEIEYKALTVFYRTKLQNGLQFLKKLKRIFSLENIILMSDIEYLANEDRKSTRLNSSHANISYAVFCLKKKPIRHHLLPGKPSIFWEDWDAVIEDQMTQSFVHAFKLDSFFLHNKSVTKINFQFYSTIIN